MKYETKRFFVILAITTVSVFILDGLVKWTRNLLEDRVIDQIKIGMTEAEAVKITGKEAIPAKSDKRDILVLYHDSILDYLFLQKTTSSGRTIKIESGKVVSIDYTRIVR